VLRVHQIPLSLDAAAEADEEALRSLAAKTLHLPAALIQNVLLKQRGIDARHKENIRFTLTLELELTGGPNKERALAARFKPNQVLFFPNRTKPSDQGLYHLPLTPWPSGQPQPLVAGAGPAGLFCALALALRGAKPILLERGSNVEKRVKDVKAFETLGRLDPESNVLFGEGGAGAFSDGKLTCGLNHPHIDTILETLHACGAPHDILTDSRPHIGTDKLYPVLQGLRAQLLAHGARVLFHHKVTGIKLRNGSVYAARVAHGGTEFDIGTTRIYLAIGHSARDTYEWLYAMGLPMEAKPFAVGARIEHRQEAIQRAQYGGAWNHPALPPADYKLSVPTPDGRGVYTFCMCPGGRVIGAVQEEGAVNVNGMSLHARNGMNANAALLTGVKPADYGSNHPLAGVEFQRRMERAAFRASGSYAALCQRSGDLVAGKASKGFHGVRPSYLPVVCPGEIMSCLPTFVVENLRHALPKLAQRLSGFNDPDALLTAPETRSSSPVRLLRNDRRESAIGGLYPLGEGAGYAGGIISAAVDGLCAGMET